MIWIGAIWYPRKMNVGEGFDAYFEFEISLPSTRCNRMDDVNTYCRSRGADGIAFVIQNVSDVALGNAGNGLGYEGIFNALAVEIDTFFNFDQLDFYENHIAVMTNGFRYNLSANHSRYETKFVCILSYFNDSLLSPVFVVRFPCTVPHDIAHFSPSHYHILSRSLATTNRIPDLTDGKHSVRIKYDPNFDDTAGDIVFLPRFPSFYRLTLVMIFVLLLYRW